MFHLNFTYPPKGKMRRHNPERDSLPLSMKLAFPFPRHGLLCHQMKGLRKRGLSGLWEEREILPQGVFGCGFFAYSWKLPAYSGAFLLTVDSLSFSAYNWSFFTYNFSFFTYSWSFFAYNGKVRLVRALRDCKQRSLTVS